jgi:hypothetical protein
MKYAFLAAIYGFILFATVFGIPLSMNLTGLSHTGDRMNFITTHDSLVRLMKTSQMNLHCQNETSKICVRPIDFSHLKPNLPIQLETCLTEDKMPICDDILMELNFRSRDLIKIGLRL